LTTGEAVAANASITCWLYLGYNNNKHVYERARCLNIP